MSNSHKINALKMNWKYITICQVTFWFHNDSTIIINYLLHYTCKFRPTFLQIMSNNDIANVKTVKQYSYVYNNNELCHS